MVTLAILPSGLVLFGSSDTVISTADTSIPDSEVTSNVSEARNSSATAGIVITMTGVLDE